jgi:hypothetical protein
MFGLSGLEGKQLWLPSPSSKNLLTTNLKEPENSLRNEPKNEPSNASPVQAAPGAATKAEKVRSSRYEWEGKNHESEKPAVASKAARRSLLTPIKALLKKLFSGDRGPRRRGFFDNDDDASPSAA